MLALRRVVFCSVVLATLALGTGIASASTINYQVTTAGCFNCTIAGPFTDVASYSGFTFDGVTNLNGATDAAGNATGFSLGDYDRASSNAGNYTDSSTGSDFILQVTFLMPLGVNGGADEFTAIIVANGPGAPGTFNFDNGWRTYSFANGAGSGTFDFRVNDVISITKNTTNRLLTGDIRNATFTPADSGGGGDLAAVPEPGSLLLLGSGLVVVARQFRRRASK